MTNNRVLSALTLLAGALGYSLLKNDAEGKPLSGDTFIPAWQPSPHITPTPSAPVRPVVVRDGAVVGANKSDVFDIVGGRLGMPAEMLRAIAFVESSHNPAAIRHEPNGKRSVGLMQVLVPQRLPAIEALGLWKGEFPVRGEASLYDPATNVEIGARILQWNLETYGYPRGIAVFNHWGARKAPEQGPFPNSNYLTKFMRELNRFGGSAAHKRLAARYTKGS